MKVKFSAKVDYYMDENTNYPDKVICIVTPETRIKNYLYRMLNGIMDGRTMNKIAIKVNDSPSYFKGTARLKSEEDYDLKQAKTVARKKAMRAMYRYYAGLVAEIIKKRQYDTDQIAEAFGSLIHKAEEIEREIIEETRK